MVVAIVGVGGIGKTTLAQKVFNDDSIQGEFDKKVWLSVNQNFDKAELLRTAITLAGGDHRGEKVLAVLQPILTEALTGKKFLLVMDDLWSNGAWEGVLKIPLINAAASGSRILITTRHERVARAMTATWPHHHIDTLSPDDAWSLLKKQVLSSETDENHINTLKDIGLKIIEKCGGLPLAVKVMGGLLCQREMQRRDWEQVLDDSKWSMTKMPEDLNNAVYLSYEDMPPYLKQCFLYCSLLPKSNRFDVLHVVGMWISEGFIHGNSNDLEELGRNYFKELISRNLIEQYEFDFEQRYCSMHDVVRSFGQYMTRDEALIAHNGEIDSLTKLSSQKFLRLSIETNQWQSGEMDWKSLQEPQSVRTLISTIQIKMKPSDSLVTFSSLRTLYIVSADVALFESLQQLKHLRYLKLVNIAISALPRNIGKMKLLQYLDLERCGNLANLPDSIVELGQLRYLNLPGYVSMIPRGFCGLTNMRILGGFPALVDGDWCSLEELGPLSQLRFLRLAQLENVFTASSAANAKLREKKHLIYLKLYCNRRRGVSEEEQQRIEKVFNELCPPPSVEVLYIEGYFGQLLPNWMMSTSSVHLNNLKFLTMNDLARCTQLPNGLCQLPYLQVLQVDRAPSIRRVGTEFLHPSQAAIATFPRLHKAELVGMVEWEEWEWEEQVQAMALLEELLLKRCKLGRVPPGLAFQARLLRKLSIEDVQHLSYLENFPFVVEITVIRCPDLERITNLLKLQKLTIINCPKLKVLKGVPSLQRLVLEDDQMETLPEYMKYVKPTYLELRCSITLLTVIAEGQSGPEFAKFSRIEHVKIYANGREWYVLYTIKPYRFDTNVNLSFLSGGTLSIFENVQRLESVLKMPRRTFDYVCSLVKERFFQDMKSHTFPDGRLLCLEDRVAIALVMLNSGEAPTTIGSSIGVNESTVLLVTKGFLNAMFMPRWPATDEMEKIKSNFDKIHHLPNCCGVVHTTRIPFGSQNNDHQKNDDILMQVIIDSDMRFTYVELERTDSESELSFLHRSQLFKKCHMGAWLNGSKVKVSSDGLEVVGEYIIGDAGYTLLPWLLTPYQLENNLSDSAVEFNKKHSEATAVVLKAMAKLKHTWKCLYGGAWRPDNQVELRQAIHTCCMLHNILIDMEGGGMPRSHKVNHSQQMSRLFFRLFGDFQPPHQSMQVSPLTHEDTVKAVKVRDILSQHFLTSRSSESGVDPVDQEEQQEVVSSGSGDKEQQEAHTHEQQGKRNSAR